MRVSQSLEILKKKASKIFSGVFRVAESIQESRQPSKWMNPKVLWPHIQLKWQNIHIIQKLCNIIYVRRTDKIYGKKPLKEHLFTCFQIQKNECLGHSGFICSTHLFKNALNFRFLMWSDFKRFYSTNSLFKILSHEKSKI